MGLMTDLADGAVAVDSAVLIYFIEERAPFISIIAPLFLAADQGRRQLVTSALTLLEVLVVPYRAGDADLAARYEALLTNSRGVRVIELTREQLRHAAQLRAVTGVKTPDAMQIVAALSAGCRTLVTNDRRLPSIPGLSIIQLDSYR